MRSWSRAALLLPLLLGACTTTTTGGGDSNLDKVEREAPHLNNDEIHADLIQQMLDKGQYYAALAHIEDAKRNGSSDQIKLLEAEARRHLGQGAQADLGQRAQAEALYRSLLDSPYAGPAYHGLGLLYTSTDLDGAIRNLNTAVERVPTNVDFRNDLGYALMEAGRYTEANRQLSTAAELAPTQVKSRNNLIILMMLEGHEDAVKLLTQDTVVWTLEQMKQLRDTAQAIRSKQAARAVKPSVKK